MAPALSPLYPFLTPTPSHDRFHAHKLCSPSALLLAPRGQLSADGQLGELIRERRSRLGGDGGILYLGPELLAAQGLAPADQEAVAVQDSAVITWLQLRFGGRRQRWQLAVAALPEGCLDLPPAVSLPW